MRGYNHYRICMFFGDYAEGKEFIPGRIYVRSEDADAQAAKLNSLAAMNGFDLTYMVQELEVL